MKNATTAAQTTAGQEEGNGRDRVIGDDLGAVALWLGHVPQAEETPLHAGHVYCPTD
jgi:hypothetical protein